LAQTSETISGGEMLGTPTECHTFVIYDDAGQKSVKICWSIPCLHPSWKVHTWMTTLVRNQNNKHHYHHLI